MIRLHLNEPPWGPPEAAVRRLRSAASRVHLYPDCETDMAEAGAAAYFDVTASQALLTTGVDEATDLCLLEFDRMHTVTPGFPGFADRARALNCAYETHALEGWDKLPPSLHSLARTGDVVMLATPNNPTGLPFGDEDITSLLGHGCCVMLDQTYADFASDPGTPVRRWLQRSDRVLVFRSFSKSFGLAGLRLGCLMGAPELISRLRARRSYLGADRLAVEAVTAVLADDPDFPARLASRVATLRDELTAVLRESGRFRSVLESHANFVFAVCLSEHDARVLWNHLGERSGIRVGDGMDFGAPAGLRFTVPNREALDRLRDALHAAPTAELTAQGVGAASHRVTQLPIGGGS